MSREGGKREETEVRLRWRRDRRPKEEKKREVRPPRGWREKRETKKLDYPEDSERREEKRSSTTEERGDGVIIRTDGGKGDEVKLQVLLIY
jgi:hypothetical protein